MSANPHKRARSGVRITASMGTQVKREVNDDGILVKWHWPWAPRQQDETERQAASSNALPAAKEDPEESGNGSRTDTDRHCSHAESVADVRLGAWVPISVVSLVRLLQDFKSTHPDPWYSIAKLPIEGAGWDVRSPTQSILTIRGVPARLFTVGPVSAMCCYSAEEGDATASRISINLLRVEDRIALQQMHKRVGGGTEVPAEPHAVRFTAIADQEGDEPFTNVFDATSSLRAREDMRNIRPWKLRVGDVVLIESIVVRNVGANGSTIAYHTDGIFRLARRPKIDSKGSLVDSPLRVPPVHFPLTL